MTHPPQNSRNDPFIPLIFDAQKQALLDEGKFNKSGNGLDSRFPNGRDVSGAGRDDASGGEDGAAYHIDHPYRDEIDSFTYQPFQLDTTNLTTLAPAEIKNRNTGKGVWIGTEEELEQLIHRINSENVKEIAIDLEAHSHRTWGGFVCLIQLSIRRGQNTADNEEDISTACDFLIDALSLRHAIPSSLGPILANPNIVKVMHGADSDIPWLQRDFGCYVLNLFDTGRASRLLKFPSAGLAYLLRKYAGVEADKTHQLSDWRRRPLPEDMREYAVSDTKYLLDIYNMLRMELDSHSLGEVSIQTVLDRSREVCLIRYEKEPFRPMGYRFLMDGKRGRKKGLAGYLTGKHEVTSDLSAEQEAALKALYDWRDKTGRREDESVHYVCPNSALLRIASNQPGTVAALQRLVNPPPPLVLRRSHEILEVLNRIKAGGGSSSSLATAVLAGKADLSESKQSTTVEPPATPSRNREMLSPILGSDVLYQKAGWMPTSDGIAASESDEDESDRRFLEVSNENQGYESSRLSSHSIQMSRDSAMSENNQAGLDSFGEDMKKGHRSAKLIQQEVTKALTGTKSKFGNGFNVMDYIRPRFEDTHLDATANNENVSCNTYDNTDVEEMIIPKSMREVYNLSNATRRCANKEKSTKSKDNELKSDKFKEDDIKQAEAVLASHSPGGYFGENKRQKKDGIPPEKEGDIELMTKLGWVRDKADAESLAVTRNSPPDNGESEHKAASTPLFPKKSSGNTKRQQGVGAAIGAFDPNAPPSHNPFFTGAATSAVLLFTGEQKNVKSGKRNKKR